ncbi:Uncharacterised protein [Chlamydia abortus]|nr:Uncharacterised protein [Chlamydia abortus]
MGLSRSFSFSSGSTFSIGNDEVVMAGYLSMVMIEFYNKRLTEGCPAVTRKPLILAAERNFWEARRSKITDALLTVRTRDHSPQMRVCNESLHNLPGRQRRST